MIETGNINFSSYKTLCMYRKKYYSPISCHRHGRNEIKQERLVTWSQEAPSPFWATESIWQVYSTDKCWVYQRAEPETLIECGSELGHRSHLTWVFLVIRRKDRDFYEVVAIPLPPVSIQWPVCWFGLAFVHNQPIALYITTNIHCV